VLPPTCRDDNNLSLSADEVNDMFFQVEAWHGGLLRYIETKKATSGEYQPGSNCPDINVSILVLNLEKICSEEITRIKDKYKIKGEKAS